MAGVVLGDICLRFAWQAWHLATSNFVLSGKHGTYGTGLALVRRLGAVTPGTFAWHAWHRFTWQAWHLATSNFVLRGRRGTYGTGLALVARLGAVTPRHFCVAGVALGDICLRRHLTSFYVAGVVLLGEVTTVTIATTPKKHNSDHLSVHQWIRSAIRESQQPTTSPIGFLF